MKIELQDIKKSFGDKVLFEHLNLEFQPGEITCLHGVSGCGKTTLLDIIGLIQKPDCGKILFNGKEVKTSRQKRQLLRNKIGFIFQDYGLIENETVLSNIKIAYDGKNKNHEIETVLDSLQLEESILKQKVHELSGGEQQRVTIVKLLLKNPDIILADEPTASLDDDNKKIVLDFLEDLASKNKVVIVVSHENYIVSRSNRVIELNEYKA